MKKGKKKKKKALDLKIVKFVTFWSATYTIYYYFITYNLIKEK